MSWRFLVALLLDAALGVRRSPVRSGGAALGTVLGIAVIVAVTGLAKSAQAGVARSFAAEQPTEVTFVDSEPTFAPQVMTEDAVARLLRMRGVESAGLVWDVDGGQPSEMSRTPDASISEFGSAPLPITAASWTELRTMGLTLQAGRTYDSGLERRHELVGLLGDAAAQQLGITNVLFDQAVFVGSTPITVIGIIASANLESQSLLGLVVPPDVASDLDQHPETRRLDVRVQRGYAAAVAKVGPSEISPFNPDRVDTEVAPNPVDLKHQVEGTVSSLLLLLGTVSFAVGMLAIANSTLLAVLQRRGEVGLRRSVGYQGRDIAVLVLSESALVGFIGGLGGIFTGLVVVIGLEATRHLPVVIDWAIIAVAPAVGLTAGLLAGIYPCVRASRITPLEALRSS